MLQYRYPWTHPSHDYWKLTSRQDISVRGYKERLNAAKYYYAKSATRLRLADMLARCERGLLSYDKFDKAELRTFCVQRGLEAGRSLEKKNDVLDLLESEDEENTFDRFLDLPPEIRNQICSLYFSTFEPLRRPYPPPVTYVSRQLRQETLLLFFQTCTFDIGIVSRRGFPWVAPLVPQSISVKDVTAQFFKVAPTTWLGSIRRVQLMGVVRAGGECTSVKWNISLDDGSSTIQIQGQPTCHPSFVPPGFWAAKNEVERQLKNTFSAIMARNGQLKLSKDDLRVLVRLFESHING